MDGGSELAVTAGFHASGGWAAMTDWPDALPKD